MLACTSRSSTPRLVWTLVHRAYSSTPSPSPSPSSPTAVGVTVSHAGAAAVVVLDRPKALNALDLPMVRALTPHYRAWHNINSSSSSSSSPSSPSSPSSSSPRVVVMKGAGGKAFCAGGDIRAMHDLGKAWHAASASTSTSAGGGQAGSVATDFFREEYSLNYLIATLPIPQVSLLNGITMGGGVGLSVHGKYRVATETTTFAMPETGIGFFCDVGGSYFLPRLPGGLGLYLGLTGNRLKGGAVKQSGVATHYVPSAQLDKLQEALTEVKSSSEVQGVLDSMAVQPPAAELIDNVAAIDRCFGGHHKDLESVFKALQEDGSAWAKEALKAMERASPTSLRVVFRQLREGAKKNNIAECLQMEYRIADAFLRPTGPSRDFFEGVRATLIDKDKQYKWVPPTLAGVPESYVTPFFSETPTGGDLKL